MPSYGLLEQHEEDNLHAQRLLGIEEKHFRRITKRLLAPDSLINAAGKPAPSPNAPLAGGSVSPHAEDLTAIEQQRKQWRDDMLLDFAAYESNIIRIQFLLNANELERERYAAEKIRIQETAQAVRENNTQLREQLKEAQKTMEIRKGYDVLADKITSNKLLKSRDEQHVAIEKLQAEIAELEHERTEYSKTWAERREQFGRIVEEGMQMLRLIKDEKEEAERKEGMDDMDDDSEPSKAGTPRVVTDGATPLHTDADGEPGSGFQRSAEKLLGVTPMTTRPSRAASTNADHTESKGEDAAMTDGEGENEQGEVEEGEATEQSENTVDKMDTT